MRKLAYLVVLLAGCAIDPPAKEAKHFTLFHGPAQFNEAMDMATAQCKQWGMNAKHTGTDRMGGAARVLSRFECVKN